MTDLKNTSLVDKAGHLHHIEIYVSDLSRSEKFWSWLLGRLGYVEYQ